MIQQQGRQLKMLESAMKKQLSAFDNAVDKVQDEEKKSELIKLQQQIIKAMEKGDIEKIQEINLKLQSFADILNT
tara:strand:- start:141 stop:365 length:225 start_codon:yes stop_codon:yes gene_type:complete